MTFDRSGPWPPCDGQVRRWCYDAVMWWCDTYLLVNLGHGIRLLSQLGRFKQFSAAYNQGQVRKRQILTFINVHKKVSIRCSVSSWIWWCSKLFFWYTTSGACSNMHLNYKHFHMVSLTRIPKNEMSFKLAIFWYIKLTFSKVIHLDVFYSIYPGLFGKLKVLKQYHFLICQVFFFKNFKIRDSSSVGLSILCHLMQRNRLNLGTCVQESHSYRPLFCIKITRTWRHFWPTYNGRNDILIGT